MNPRQRTTLPDLPKYLCVKRSIQDRIARGDFSAGDSLPSEQELARDFKASRQTVIRALNELRLEGMISRRQGKGSFVSGAAGRRNQIGILTYVDKTAPCLSAYPQNLLRSLVNRLHQLGEHPQIFTTFGSSPLGDIHQHGQEVLEQCARGHIRCLIAASGYYANEWENALAPCGAHVVGAHQEKALSRFNFGLDKSAEAETGLRCLLEKGFRKIAVMAGRPTHVGIKREVQTYLRLMEEHRLAIRPGWICSDEEPTPKAGYLQFQRFWSMDDHPQALLIADDIMAQGAVKAMIELGVKTPDHLKVVVAMNRWSGIHFPIPITALEMDLEPLGVAGAEMAHALVTGKQPDPAQIWVRPNLRIFDSENFPADSNAGDAIPAAAESGCDMA